MHREKEVGHKIPEMARKQQTGRKMLPTDTTSSSAKYMGTPSTEGIKKLHQNRTGTSIL